MVLGISLLLFLSCAQAEKMRLVDNQGVIFSSFTAEGIFANTIQVDKIRMGRGAGASMSTGSGETFVGIHAGNKNTSGVDNTFVGHLAGKENIEGNENTFVGYQSGINSMAHHNTFMGSYAGANNTSGSDNTFIGNYCGRNNVSGIGNACLGYSTCRKVLGGGNTVIGQYAADLTTTGNDNTFMGNNAGRSNIGGSGNVFLGDHAGYTNTSGNQNVCVGPYACYNKNAGTNNRLEISNAITSEPLIWGDFADRTIIFNATKVSVGSMTSATDMSVWKDANRYVGFETHNPNHGVDAQMGYLMGDDHKMGFISMFGDGYVDTDVAGKVVVGQSVGTDVGALVISTMSISLFPRLNMAGPLRLDSKTMADLEALTPDEGDIYYCSDCINGVHVLVGTGTLSGFDSFVGGVAWH